MSVGGKRTTDVETLLGNPKKAVIAMALPIMIGIIVQTSNNLIDTAWVSGLGPGALAATGYAFPLFMIMISIGNGIGIGASSAISRYIGMGDKDAADRTAGQAILLSLLISIMMAILMFFSMDALLGVMAVEEYVDLCREYLLPLIVMSPAILLGSVMSHILRSEGASKKAMMILILGAALNMVMDPFFIYDYGLGLGVSGASWATVISMSVSTLVLLYMFFFSNKTYLKININRFRLDKTLDGKVLRVGLPASMEMIAISLITIFINSFVTMIDPENGVAVYSSVWKILQFFFIPAMAFSMSLVPVCAAALGQQKYDKILVAYRYAITLVLSIMIVVIVIILLGSEYIVSIFTYSEESAVLKDDLAYALRVCCIFIPFYTSGFVTIGLFQSLGKGIRSLCCTVFRTSLLIPASCLAVYTFSTMEVFWIYIAVAQMLGSSFIIFWGVYTIYKLLKSVNGPGPSCPG